MYNIKKYSYDQAKKLNVTIKPSTHKNKKIDVYDQKNKLVASIGDMKYKNNNYPTYLLQDKKLADDKRRLYKIRHKKDLNVKDSPGYYANRILW